VIFGKEGGKNISCPSVATSLVAASMNDNKKTSMMLKSTLGVNQPLVFDCNILSDKSVSLP